MPISINHVQKEDVREMFDDIAPKYDFLNHFLSMGIDKRWRKRLRKEMAKNTPISIIDVATGTGDLAFELSKIKEASIIGVDIAEKMLIIAKEKSQKKKLNDRVSFQLADGSELPFSDNSFDAASISFGIRNFENPQKGLEDILRVLKPGGYAYILEFGKPEKQPMKSFYKLYSSHILPFFGKLFSGHTKAYKYLPSSVKKFLFGDNFCELMKTAGFEEARFIKLTFGIVYLYIGKK
ncbi:MAG: bifunctional demethylmenaquinone methyltransferase/2-methoxy-6-polyprenyl-1,4-benzoquinol methylase UbiE [Bacteroidetes bacterium]|nr:bifunctional demethylmenaquinone methyltransferase/2-methoxy-6-polyprenyl-1,4-benzoquinol methylase UbiE [Bacteroidota bacterium]